MCVDDPEAFVRVLEGAGEELLLQTFNGGLLARGIGDSFTDTISLAVDEHQNQSSVDLLD